MESERRGRVKMKGKYGSCTPGLRLGLSSSGKAVKGVLSRKEL